MQSHGNEFPEIHNNQRLPSLSGQSNLDESER